MPDVISDTSPIQYLYQTEMLDLLPGLFGQVFVPEAVLSELDAGLRQGVDLPNLKEIPWLNVCAVSDRTPLSQESSLGEGEREVIALGQERPGSMLPLDDRNARRHAIALGLKISGTLGVLLLAKEEGLLDSVRTVLDRLQRQRFRLDPLTRRTALALAREDS